MISCWFWSTLASRRIAITHFRISHALICLEMVASNRNLRFSAFSLNEGLRVKFNTQLQIAISDERLSHLVPSTVLNLTRLTLQIAISDERLSHSHPSEPLPRLPCGHLVLSSSRFGSLVPSVLDRRHVRRIASSRGLSGFL